MVQVLSAGLAAALTAYIVRVAAAEVLLSLPRL